MNLMKTIFKIFSYILYLIPGVWVALVVSNATKKIENTKNIDVIIKNTQKINIWCVGFGAFIWGCVTSYFIMKANNFTDPEQFIYLGILSIVLFVIFCYKKIKYT